MNWCQLFAGSLVLDLAPTTTTTITTAAAAAAAITIIVIINEALSVVVCVWLTVIITVSS